MLPKPPPEEHRLPEPDRFWEVPVAGSWYRRDPEKEIPIPPNPRCFRLGENPAAAARQAAKVRKSNKGTPSGRWRIEHIPAAACSKLEKRKKALEVRRVAAGPIADRLFPDLRSVCA